MTEYCSDEDIRKRLTTAGRKFLADRNRSGTVDAAEITDTITEGIQEAGSIIDTHLCRRYGNTAAIRGQQNDTLKRLAIHLAVFHIVSTGGRDNMPGPLQDARDKAIETLEQIAGNNVDVPGLVSNVPTYGPQMTTKTARVANV
jgi:phage gp36-like protein